MKKGLALCVAAVLFAASAYADEARDAEYLADVVNTRLETQRTGVETRWANPITGNNGDFTILSTDDSDPERPCRTYRLTTEPPGQPVRIVEGKACRIAPRLWQRTESAASTTPVTDPAPVAEPAEPPPVIPPPGHRPDPDVFFASVPTPSVY